jgi:dipeptidyl aminopeptidase/acylaminoacyl peptidase
VELVIFPAEGHNLSRSGSPLHREMRFEAILDWFARKLLGETRKSEQPAAVSVES